jgi:hypothetical protein
MNASDPNASEPRKLWTFPEGAVSHDQSVKGYRCEATDGEVGEVSWADYAPGQSYLVLTHGHHRNEVHHVVPAGAIANVDHDKGIVTLNVTCDEVKATPEHKEPELEVNWDQVNQFERGMLGGGSVWPYGDK